jgi:glycerol-3-phosphate acyltransferase PlsY
LDVLKGFATIWIVAWLAPGMPWVNVVAALAAILGHNYSIFLLEKKVGGGIRLRGGAGGATAFGGAMALWPTAGLFLLPIGLLVFLLVGYSSVTTLSIGLITGGIFLIRAIQGLSPWVNVLYGAFALFILVYALRPNLARLKAGTERVVGLRAYLQKRQHQLQAVGKWKK